MQKSTDAGAGGHRGSSFSGEKHFFKIVPHNKQDECEGYEELTGIRVPTQKYDESYTEKQAKNYMSELLQENDISSELNKSYILPVAGKMIFTQGKKPSSVVVLPKLKVILDVKVGNKSDNNKITKILLNCLYQAKNNHNGYFVDSTSALCCTPCVKYKQAKIDITNATISNIISAQNALQNNIAKNLQEIHELCREKLTTFNGASIFLCNDKGTINAKLADLSHPHKVKNTDEFDRSIFARGLQNLRNYINLIDENQNRSDTTHPPKEQFKLRLSENSNSSLPPMPITNNMLMYNNENMFENADYDPFRLEELSPNLSSTSIAANIPMHNNVKMLHDKNILTNKILSNNRSMF